MTDYSLLEKAVADSTARYRELSDKIKTDEKRMNDIRELQRHIGVYGKTREIYRAYRASGKSVNFYEAHRADIVLHEAAKHHFDESGYGKSKKLPSMQSLKQEYAILAAGKGKLYSEFKQARQKMIELQMAKQNVDYILNAPTLPAKTYKRALVPCDVSSQSHRAVRCTADADGGLNGRARKRPPGGVWGGSTNKHFTVSAHSRNGKGAAGIYRRLACKLAN